jgi:KipI family sensor histidine kinase inhibitor
MQGYRLLPAGDTALVVEFGDGIEQSLSASVLALSNRLGALALPGISETVPTFRSLMIQFDPLVLPQAALKRAIASLMQDMPAVTQPGRSWRLPACYDASLAPDLAYVASECGLSPAQVIERHCAVIYHVYMLGFLPGQAYMGDLAPELALPRRKIPRMQIAPGALAIATKVTCIFPRNTPCGWHLIGRSPVALWRNAPEPHALLSPGDKVTFAPVSLREYEDMLARAADNPDSVEDESRWMGAAA